MDEALIFLVPLLAGWLLDIFIGDPAWLPHPVVAFGKAISFCEHRLNRGSGKAVKGAITAVILAGGVFAAANFGLRWLGRWEWAEIAVAAVLVFYCLAGTTLCREVKAVFEAVDKSLDDGRRQVARIVGRDTAALSAQEIRIAALETLAENLSDGVIAPLFWYAVAGVPGMLAYKMVNTLDSMIGYRNERYRKFGCFAARLDDVANYIPARLTAWLMVLAAGRPGLIKFVMSQGPRHASPNSGYPEAALAGILDCRFGGPHDYFGECVEKPFIGTNDRAVDSSDMRKAIKVNRIAEVMMVALVALTVLFRIPV